MSTWMSSPDTIWLPNLLVVCQHGLHDTLGDRPWGKIFYALHGARGVAGISHSRIL